MAAIKISSDPVNHSRVKHIDTKFHFIREQVDRGVVKLQYCGTEQMIADALTKPLARERFQALCAVMGMSQMAITSEGV